MLFLCAKGRKAEDPAWLFDPLDESERLDAGPAACWRPAPTAISSLHFDGRSEAGGRPCELGCPWVEGMEVTDARRWELAGRELAGWESKEPSEAPCVLGRSAPLSERAG